MPFVETAQSPVEIQLNILRKLRCLLGTRQCVQAFVIVIVNQASPPLALINNASMLKCCQQIGFLIPYLIPFRDGDENCVVQHILKVLPRYVVAYQHLV
jgi:hypothetical protein